MSESLFDQPETDPRVTAQSGLRSLLLRVVAAEHGPSAVAERPLAPGLRTTAPAPVDPRQGLAAARLLHDADSELLRTQATVAGREGVSWHEVGAALGLWTDEGASLGETAFEEVAGDPARRFDRRVVFWTCASCGRSVTDYGPYTNNPDDDQDGHDADCARFAAKWHAEHA